MIKDARLWQAWEDDLIRNEPADYPRNLRIFEAMYEQARALGVWEPTDPLEGIETKIRMAKVLNVQTPPRRDRHRT